MYCAALLWQYRSQGDDVKNDMWNIRNSLSSYPNLFDSF